MTEVPHPRWALAKGLITKMTRFALGGAVGTLVDYGVYFLLYKQGASPVVAQLAAYSTAVIFNFFFQKYFVFQQKGDTRTTFLWSMLVSLIGLGLSTLIIYLLNLHPFFQAYQIVAKLLTTGSLFFYNFYCKRYVFEKLD